MNDQRPTTNDGPRRTSSWRKRWAATERQNKPAKPTNDPTTTNNTNQHERTTTNESTHRQQSDTR